MVSPYIHTSIHVRTTKKAENRRHLEPIYHPTMGGGGEQKIETKYKIMMTEYVT